MADISRLQSEKARLSDNKEEAMRELASQKQTNANGINDEMIQLLELSVTLFGEKIADVERRIADETRR